MYVAAAPSENQLIDRLGTGVAFAGLTAPVEVARDRYLHWDKLRRMPPPTGLSSEQWWLRLKRSRHDTWVPLPLEDRAGEALGFTSPNLLQPALHRVDVRRCSRAAGLPSWRADHERFMVDAWMEEAIRSSQLEGATTARGTAKELLRSGRPPRDHSEKMIADNYEGMRFMREEMAGPLTPEQILELHRVVAARTLGEPAAGRLQQPGEERVAVRDHSWEVLYLPPPAEQLPERMERLCEFANASADEAPFVHPVVRAILLHFWLAYDHPFLDGNGRTARILFFWAMREQGYWFAEYLPLSLLIGEARGQYERAFLEVESDGGDTTYFLLNQLATIERAIERFDRYVERKSAEQREAKDRLHDVEGINGRQLVLLTHAIKHPDHTYTFAGHAHSNRVTHETARADLGALADRGLLVRRKQGRSYNFEPAPDLPSRLRESPR